MSREALLIQIVSTQCLATNAASLWKRAEERMSREALPTALAAHCRAMVQTAKPHCTALHAKDSCDPRMLQDPIHGLTCRTPWPKDIARSHPRPHMQDPCTARTNRGSLACKRLTTCRITSLRDKVLNMWRCRVASAASQDAL